MREELNAGRRACRDFRRSSRCPPGLRGRASRRWPRIRSGAKNSRPPWRRRRQKRRARWNYISRRPRRSKTTRFSSASFHLLMAGAVTVHALLTKRDVPAAIGWIGLAWLAPVLGSILYAGFGVNRVRRRAKRLKGPVRSHDSSSAGDEAPDEPLDRLKAAVGRITGRELAPGKVAAVLDCGDEAYPQMLAAIESAKNHIRLCSYIFRADMIGVQFIDALAGAHSQRGQDPRPDRRVWRRIRPVPRLSSVARSRRPGIALPSLDAAVEDAVPRSPAAQEMSGR